MASEIQTDALQKIVNALQANQQVLGQINKNLIAALGKTLTSAHIYVGNSSNVAADVAASGDVTLANTGAFTVNATHLGSPLPIAQGGTADSGTAWTTYTPTVSVGSGSMTTKTATGRSKTLGKTTWIEILLLITTNGSAATSISLTLPNTAGNTKYALAAHNDTTGTACTALIESGGTTVTLFKYDGSYPGADSTNLVVGGVYESA